MDEIKIKNDFFNLVVDDIVTLGLVFFCSIATKNIASNLIEVVHRTIEYIQTRVDDGYEVEVDYARWI